MPRADKPKLSALQAMRALAAGMVVFVHGISTYQAKVTPGGVGLSTYDYGDLGVKLFFCISGFIIFASAADKQHGVLSAWGFARKRVIRVVPLYWLATGIYAIKLGLQGQWAGPDETVRSFLFLPYLNDAGLMRPILGQGWTLNFEMFFYISMGLALFMPRTARLPVLAASMILMVEAGRQGAFKALGLTGLDLLASTYMYFFVAGMLVGRLNGWLKHRDVLRPGGLTLSMGVAAMLLALVHFTPTLDAIGAWLAISVELGVCGLWVLGAALYEPGAAPGRFGGTIERYVVLAGDGSYSTYLTHGFVMGPLARLISLGGVDVGPIAFSVVSVVLCTLIGTLVYQWVETPLIRALSARWPDPEARHRQKNELRPLSST